MKSEKYVSTGRALHCVRPRISGACALVLSAVITVIAQLAAAADPVIELNIPAQPLTSALDAFSTATESVAVYNGNLAVGLVSNGLRGRFTPARALALMLKGTGLVGEYTAPNAFVVVPSQQHSLVTSTPEIAVAALSGQNADERSYSGLLQTNIGRALCVQPQTRPGGYRAVISFWIGPTGEVVRPRLLSSTGDDRRDAAITAILGRLSVGETPPARMPQPFTMVLLPQRSDGIGSCPALQGRGQRDG